MVFPLSMLKIQLQKPLENFLIICRRKTNFPKKYINSRGLKSLMLSLISLPRPIINIYLNLTSLYIKFLSSISIQFNYIIFNL